MKKYLFAFLLLAGCSKNSDSPVVTPPPIINQPPGPDDIQITRVTQPWGYTGDLVQVIGKNFGSDTNAITAKINNVSTTVKSVSGGTELYIRVPAKCGIGTITLTRNGYTATGPSFYYIPSVTVTTLYGNFNKGGFVNGSGTNMRLNNPWDFTFDKNGNIYLCEYGGILGTTPGSLIRKIDGATGQLSTFSGGPLEGNTANYNALWFLSLPGNVNNSVNGGNARFNYPSGIAISEDPLSNAFKLIVSQNNFIRVINEATATGVLAGNPHDTTGGGTPNYGGRHEAHIFPLSAPVLFPNGNDYGSPTLYWLDAGPSLSKMDANGNISALADLKKYQPTYLTKSPDGKLYMHGISAATSYAIFTSTTAGEISTWLSAKDSVFNRASGKNESFGNDIDKGGVRSFNFDKDGNLFMITYGSSYTDLYKFFPDKSFVRIYHWLHKFTGVDGLNSKADVLDTKKMIIRNNGDIYFIDGLAIRKMSFE